MPVHCKPTIVTLTTDFGLSDPWVAELKAAILRVSTDLTLIDISHTVTVFHIRQAAYVVDTASRQFPSGTIHVVGVDPHPSDRGLLVLSRGQYFIGPDNGVFAPLWGPDRTDTNSVPVRVFQLDQPQFWGHPQPTTFRARDLFGPVAGHLTRGVNATQTGSPIPLESLTTNDVEPHSCETDKRSGEVIHVDRFGNLITSISAGDLPEDTTVQIAEHRITGLCQTYDAPRGDQPLMALAGSSGYLEICVPCKSAAEFIGRGLGTPVSVHVGSDVSNSESP
ncbi:MAG: SAM-dependent chlorinase/fluorinase [Planctomycetaceae bacterium]